jgi:hypothetical protein
MQDAIAIFDCYPRKGGNTEDRFRGIASFVLPQRSSALISVRTGSIVQGARVQKITVAAFHDHLMPGGIVLKLLT